MNADPDSLREVIVAAAAWRARPFADDEAEAAAIAAMNAAAAELGLSADQGWAVLLTDDAGQRRLNADHRGKDQPTNVLSFPAHPPGEAPAAGHIGDISIAIETVLAEALDAGKPAVHHLAHMVTHGLAHLAGHDHVTDTEAEAMEALEVRALARLDIPNPYSESTRKERDAG